MGVVLQLHSFFFFNQKPKVCMTEVVLLVKRKKEKRMVLYSHTHGSIMFKHTYMKYKREEEAVGVEGVRWSRWSFNLWPMDNNQG